jgi:type II secretory pathway component PulF
METNNKESKKISKEDLKEVEEWLEIGKKLNQKIEKEIEDDTIFKDMDISEEESAKLKKIFKDFIKKARESEEEDEKLIKNLK